MSDTPFILDPYISKIPDFPKTGITFYDISPALEDAYAFSQMTKAFCEKARSYSPDMLVGIDARGFLFGAAAAVTLKCGVVMIRKTGKLPGETIETSYSLEYGEARLALQTARHVAGKRILLCDDLLATGGTLAAAESLVTKVGGIVCGAVCAIELTGLKGRDKLSCPVSVLQTYES